MTAEAPADVGDRHRAYLDQVSRLLWPHRTAAAVSVGGRVRLDPPRSAPGDRLFVVVPHLRRPAVLVPLSPSRVTSAVLKDYKTSASPARRRLLRLLGVAARAGAGALLPDRLVVRGADDGIEQYLSDVLGEDLVVSVMIGPARANRKPVLQLIDRQGDTRGFAKIGVNPLTDDLVRHEGETLSMLAAARPPGVTVPTLLHAGTWNDHPIVVQSPVGGGAQAPQGSLLTAGVRAISEVGGTTCTPMTGTRYWQELGRRIDALPGSPVRERLRALHERLSALHRDTTVTVGSWHGDLTPWNVAYGDADLQVWDWERFASGVPAGYDAHHFSLQRDIVRAGMEPAAAVRRLLAEGPDADLGWHGDRAEAEATAVAYLLEIGTRYVGDGLAEIGGALGDLSTWLLPAAETHLNPA